MIDGVSPLHKFPEFTRFERETLIRPRQLPADGEMLLQHTGAFGHRAERGIDADRVIGQSDRQAESLSQDLDGSQLYICVSGRIGRGTLQENQRHVVALDEMDRLGNFLQLGHTGRHDHWQALSGDMLDERKIGDLSRPDLVGRDPQLIKSIGGFS